MSAFCPRSSVGDNFPPGALVDSVTGGTICITASNAAKLNTVLAGFALKPAEGSSSCCQVHAASAVRSACIPNVVPSRHMA